MCGFTQLHNHTEYSMLDGLSSCDQYVSAAIQNGFDALAITDHGNMHGVVEFDTALRSANIHPVLGIEFYATPFGTGYDDRSRSPNHLLALAKTQAGYQNLLLLTDLSYQSGFYYKPRITIESLAQYSDGVVTTSGCMAAHIPSAIGRGDLTQADAMVRWYLDTFGDNFYIELQRHPGIDELDDINKHLVGFAKQYGIQMILTNDSHYATPDSASVHDVLLCVQTKSNINKEGRFKFTDNEYYLKSRDAMMQTFRGALSEEEIIRAMTNAHELAHLCEASPQLGGVSRIPEFKLDSNITHDEYLRQLVYKNVERVYPDWQYNEKVKAQIEEELSIIAQTRFASYFLIIWDICNYAKSQKIPFNTRGSAAGSIVNYIIGVSFVDPLANDLMFSRFLNPYRVSIPDCDLDFQDTRRTEMFEYIIRKYGEDFVAQVVTFGHMKARATIRDVARALDVPQYKADLIAKSIKNTPGKPITLSNSLDPNSEYFSAEFHDLVEKDEDTQKIMEFAPDLENVVRHSGIHAAAILIGDVELRKLIPLMASKKARTRNVAQFDYTTSESLGLLKVDLLGLITLGVIDECINLINQRHGTNYNMNNIPYMDESSFRLLSNGETIGVFQVENSGLTKYLIQMQPSTFGHVADMISLYRPGPISYIPNYINRMKGLESVQLKHPLLSGLTSETQGIMIYQEQVNQVLMTLGGYHAGDADKVRKAISKKSVSDIEKNRHIFVEGCSKNGIDAKVAESVYDDINEFALYGFNRCISGREILFRDNNQHKSLTIEEMYKIKNSLKYAKSVGSTSLHYKYKKNGYGTAYSMNDDNRIVSNQIVDIRYAGVKSTYTVRLESGKEILLTENHKCPTPNGIKLVRDLKAGDEFYVKDTYDGSQNTYNLYPSKMKVNSEKGKCGFQKRENGHSVIVKSEIEKHKNNRDKCEDCGLESNKYELHHVDFDKYNNDVQNLAWLCPSCHKKRHYRHGRNKRYEHGILTKTEKIISITANEPEDVYDVEMSAPYHNFVTKNGIVTCNSHAASYARITLITAWLKANYTIEFLTACLICEGADNSKRTKYIQDAVRAGITVLPPQIGGSENFSIVNNQIVFGLAAIDGIGASTAKQLSRTNTEEVFELGLKRNQIENLVKAGCFDFMGDRLVLLSNIDQLSTYAKTVSKWKKINQRLMYYPEIKMSTEKISLFEAAIFEGNVLGAWITYHPMQVLPSHMKESVTRISEVGNSDYVIGVITRLEQLSTRKGSKMYKFVLVDEFGSIEIIAGAKVSKDLNLRDGMIVHCMVSRDSEEDNTFFTNRITVMKT